jgi:hypothetical protein
MDERAIKRLLIIFAASLIAIFVFKTMLSKTIVNLNKAAAEKKQATKPSAAREVVTPPSDSAAIIETPAASTADEVPTQGLSAASGVGEAQ